MTSAVTVAIPGDPDALFRAITDIDGLGRWNRAITSVVETPAELIEGSEWVVELHALGQTWRSRSKLLHLDPATRQFAYRSSTDDGNPSWVDWQWSVDDHPAGAEVTVTWQLYPVTFWRRVLFSHIRNRQLARIEVPQSLTAISRHIAAPNPHA